MADPIGPFATGYDSTAVLMTDYYTGSKIVIGDGVWLTAGHIVYEWDRKADATPNILYRSSYASKVDDYKLYVDA